METNQVEKSQFFEVLRIVHQTPGLTASALAGTGKARDRTKESRLADLTMLGLIEAREDTYRGRTCMRYHLTDKGEQMILIAALIEKL